MVSVKKEMQSDLKKGATRVIEARKAGVLARLTQMEESRNRKLYRKDIATLEKRYAELDELGAEILAVANSWLDRQLAGAEEFLTRMDPSFDGSAPRVDGLSDDVAPLGVSDSERKAAPGLEQARQNRKHAEKRRKESARRRAMQAKEAELRLQRGVGEEGDLYE